MSYAEIKISGKVVSPHKAIVNPDFKCKNVLTDSPWDFVDLWLRREKENEALFYWDQARAFNNASKNLPVQSAPLLLYYSFMNAVKALLSSKHITFNPYHGIQEKQIRTNNKNISLANEAVKIKTHGILPSLSDYFAESETNNIHTLKDLLLNLPYIHRTYCLTYKSQKDIFIPVKESSFVLNKRDRRMYFQCILSNDFSNHHTVNRLPSTLALHEKRDGKYVIRSVDSRNFSSAYRPNVHDKQTLIGFHKELRNVLFYINGSTSLWYIKVGTSSGKIINRFSSTITLAAMHRLSELCRYKPLELNSFLSGQQNWLLTEFIKQSPNQFIDEIASEITGYQFLIPNIRDAI